MSYFQVQLLLLALPLVLSLLPYVPIPSADSFGLHIKQSLLATKSPQLHIEIDSSHSL